MLNVKIMLHKNVKIAVIKMRVKASEEFLWCLFLYEVLDEKFK